MSTYAGTLWYFSASTPATFNSAGYAALTWTAATGYAGMDEVGDTATHAEFTDLGTGRTTREPAVVDGGQRKFNFKDIPTDAGQILVKANAGGSTAVSVKIVYPNTKIKYLNGYLSPVVENAADPKMTKGFSVTLSVNSAPVDA